MPGMFKGKLFKKNKIDCNFILSSELLVILPVIFNASFIQQTGTS